MKCPRTRLNLSKLIACVVTLTLTAGCSQSQLGVVQFLLRNERSINNVIDKGRIPYRARNWVFINKVGKIAIDKKFRSVSSFTDGVAIAGDGPDNWDVAETAINKAGKQLFPTGFKAMSPAVEDFFIVTGPLCDYRQDVQKVVTDQSLPRLRQTFYSTYRGIWHQHFAKCGHFDHGVALVYTDGYTDRSQAVTPLSEVSTKRPKRYFLVDKYAQEIGKIDGTPQNTSLDFFQGLQPAAKVGKIGFIDNKGDWAVRPIYARAENFQDSFAKVMLPGANNKWFFIDKTGKKVFDGEFDQVSDFHEVLASFGDTNQDFGFIDETGKQVIRAASNIKRFGKFSEGKARFNTTDGAEGFIDNKGKIVIQAIPNIHFGDFHEGLCIANTGSGKNALYGFIDARGAWNIPASYSNALDFSDGLAAVQLPHISDQDAPLKM